MGNMRFIAKKNKFLSFTWFALQNSEKVTFIEWGEQDFGLALYIIYVIHPVSLPSLCLSRYIYNVSIIFLYLSNLSVSQSDRQRDRVTDRETE